MNNEKSIPKKLEFSQSYLKTYTLFGKILLIGGIIFLVIGILGTILLSEILTFSSWMFPPAVNLLAFAIIILHSKNKDPIDNIGKLLIFYGIMNAIYLLMIILATYVFTPLIINVIFLNMTGLIIEFWPIWVGFFAIGIFMMYYSRKSLKKS
ncbi:MAG: hypothetical protein ACTSPY_12035 [Candidatus Helarchaeota archaeon]